MAAYKCMSGGKLEAPSESESEDDDVTPIVAPSLTNLLAGGGSDSESDDDDVRQKIEPKGAPENAAASGVTLSTTSSSAAGENASLRPSADGDASLLPSADALLDSSDKPDFLKMPDGPDFDASKHFKPPPVSHSDMLPNVKDMGYRPPPASLDDEAPPQRFHPEENYGHGQARGFKQQRGSVCSETDDERGRRVVYGAHQALAADPWSNCNPNKPFRGFGGGKKRKNGDV